MGILAPMPKLSALSRRRLIGVHPDLVRLIEAAIAITPVDRSTHP